MIVGTAVTTGMFSSVLDVKRFRGVNVNMQSAERKMYVMFSNLHRW